MSTVYQWAPGFCVGDLDAQKVGARIETLRKKNGGSLKPAIIVADAASKSSPMHGFFEWNDRKAADKYRLSQAGYLLRAIVTQYAEGKPQTRAFVAVQYNGERKARFTSISVAMQDEDLRNQVLAAAKAELNAWRERYKDLTELASLFLVIDQLELVAA